MLRLFARAAGARDAVEPDEGEIPRYPPFMQGLPAVDAERIVSTQRDLIGAILQTASPESGVREHYLAAIRALAGHAHLLPASQAHHHRGAGGLFRHSLEVALFALQMAHKHLPNIDATPAARRELEPRWAYAAFLCGLCHDAGKPCADLHAIDERRTTTWNPLYESLPAWAARHGVRRYYLEWREGRGRAHVALTALAGSRLIAGDTLDWLASGGVDLLAWIAETMADNPAPANPLHAIVIRADQLSVERDLKEAGMRMAGGEVGLPVERMLQDIMRRFVREGVWLVNCPGARVWKIDGEVYLVWPAGGEELADAIRRDRLPGMPRTAQALLDMMVERGLASLRDRTTPALWRIAPAPLAGLGAAGLTAIRLRSDNLVSVAPLAEVEGSVLDESRSRAVLAADAASPAAGSSASGREEGKGAHDHDDQAGTAEGRSGPAWEVLSALAEDLSSGDRDPGRLLRADEEGRILLRWPEAVEEYGIEPRLLLDDMKSRGWVVADPMNPTRLLMDAVFAGENAKAACLTGPAVGLFVALATGKDEQTDARPQGAGAGLIERLIEALSGLSESQEDDGWAVVRRHRAVSALRRLGVSDAASELAALSERHADRLVIKGNNVVFKP